jgi:hypothetical protein
MGDVKLALLLVVGLDGSALRALALGLAFAALVGLVRVVRDGRVAWRASLPLAPFLAAGALLTVITSTLAQASPAASPYSSAQLRSSPPLALACGLRPSFPPLPRSFSAPLPASTISRTLDLAAWVVFVLLDLVLFINVMKLALGRTPRRSSSGSDVRSQRVRRRRSKAEIGAGTPHCSRTSRTHPDKA